MCSRGVPRRSAVELGAEPGPAALALAASLDVVALSSAALLDAVGEVERSLAWAAAVRSRLIAEYASRGPTEVVDAVSELDQEWHREPLAAICQTSPHEAHVRAETALALRDRLALTSDALASGSLPWAQAVVLARETDGLDLEASSAVERRVLADPRAVSVRQVALAARAAVAELQPARAEEQALEAQEARFLSWYPHPCITGLTRLVADLPSDAAALIEAALAPSARQTGSDDDRSCSQRRADALVSVCTGERPPVVHLQLLARGPALTGLLAGEPLTGRTTRRLACTAEVSVHPLGRDGTVAPTAAELHRAPGAAMRRRLEARDGGCAFPGCPTRAARCHAHHLRHWADGGPTVEANLTLLCSRHHHAVHEGGWALTGPPTLLVWNDPHGRVYQHPPAAATLRPWVEDPPLLPRGPDRTRGAPNREMKPAPGGLGRPPAPVPEPVSVPDRHELVPF